MSEIRFILTNKKYTPGETLSMVCSFERALMAIESGGGQYLLKISTSGRMTDRIEQTYSSSYYRKACFAKATVLEIYTLTREDVLKIALGVIYTITDYFPMDTNVRGMRKKLGECVKKRTLKNQQIRYRLRRKLGDELFSKIRNGDHRYMPASLVPFDLIVHGLLSMAKNKNWAKGTPYLSSSILRDKNKDLLEKVYADCDQYILKNKTL